MRVRPELRPFVRLYVELAMALGTLGAGLYWAALGGLLLPPIGLLCAATALVWARTAWRRIKFARIGEAQGLVEVTERRVSFYGAGQGLGGTIDLDELAEIRLLSLQGRAHWRLKTPQSALLIPADALGAEALFDAFAALPAIDMGVLALALSRFGKDQGDVARLPAQSLWRRSP